MAQGGLASGKLRRGLRRWRRHHSQEYVVLEAGEFAFVKIGVYPGRWVVNCQTFSVPAAVGREEVLRGKRVQELPPRTQ